MIIDVHGHLVPPDLVAQIRKDHGRLPSLRLVEQGESVALAFAGGKASRPIMKGLSDVAGRLAWMGREGIDRQVNGSWPDWFGYEPGWGLPSKADVEEIRRIMTGSPAERTPAPVPAWPAAWASPTAAEPSVIATRAIVALRAHL